MKNIETAEHIIEIISFENIAEEIYKQLHGSLCLSKESPKDTIIANIETGLRHANIKKNMTLEII